MRFALLPKFRHIKEALNRKLAMLPKGGVEMRNYEDIQEAAKLKPIEVELKRLEDLSDSIVRDFALMRKREEEEMRDTKRK